MNHRICHKCINFDIIKRYLSMSNRSTLGLSQCFPNFAGAYCYRKSIECLCSSILLIASLIVFSLLLYKHRIDRQIWMSLILLSMILVLIDNIIFCFYNQQYWLFATQSYLFSLYYLAVVSYVCKAYILKKRSFIPDANTNVRQNDKLQNPQTRMMEQIIFYGTVSLLGVIYTAIFITSVIFEDKEKSSQQSNNPSKVRYCEQIWYLCFDILCMILSIAVLIVLYKNQREEEDKLAAYEGQYQNKPNSFVTNEDIQGNQFQALVGQKLIHNPLRQVWVWILLNVVSQVLNLVEAGLYLSARPPTCMLIYSKPEASNIIQIVFLFLTMYMGFVGTLWYIVQVKMVREKSVIDRTIRFTDQSRHDGNIELFLPSKQDSVTF